MPINSPHRDRHEPQVCRDNQKSVLLGNPMCCRYRHEMGGRGVDRDEIGAVAARMLAEARAVRAAFPDVVPGGDLPPVPPGGGVGPKGALWRALRCLRDEVQLVRAGAAGTVAVLEDEIACVERLVRGG